MDYEPTVITSEDIDKFAAWLMSYEMHTRPCMQCNKEFYPNYHECLCDGCYFAQFPKDAVDKYYRSLLGLD